MSTLYFPQALSRLLAESYPKGSGSNSEEVGEEGGAVGQGVAISTIWAIAAETKHSRRQFQKRIANVLSHGRQTGEEYLVNHTYCQKLGTNHSAVRQWYLPYHGKLLAIHEIGTQRFEDGIISYKITRPDELSSRGKVKVP